MTGSMVIGEAGTLAVVGRGPVAGVLKIAARSDAKWVSCDLREDGNLDC